MQQKRNSFTNSLEVEEQKERKKERKRKRLPGMMDLELP